MAEAIGIAASIVGLLNVSTKVSKHLCGIPDAPELAHEVLAEVTACKTVLDALKPLLSGATSAGNASLINVEDVVTILVGCMYTFSKLEETLDGLYKGKSREGEPDMERFDCVRWTIKQGDLQKLLNTLQNHKHSLNLLLTIHHCKRQEELQTEFESLRTLLQDSRDSIPNLNESMSEADSIVPIRDYEAEAKSCRPSIETKIFEPSINRTTGSFLAPLLASRVYQRVAFRESTSSFKTFVTSESNWAQLRHLGIYEVSNLSFLLLPINTKSIYCGEQYLEPSQLDVNKRSIVTRVGTRTVVVFNTARTCNAPICSVAHGTRGPGTSSHDTLVGGDGF
ncbi:hypothetical protein EDC01DRAFT_370276 [Geopyxis carbonaria]|nr:hypothetical protein EDC01DRAFT_370276 [Geopyxis carbonaria]